jgi:lipid-binding SYLF domain-containing protein
MSKLITAVTLVLICGLATLAKTKQEKQAEARNKANETLERLYKAKPSARAAVKGAVGYAVFTSKSLKILIGGSGRGSGIAVEKVGNKVTYMKMTEFGAGLGMGVKKFSVVFIFENKKALDDFLKSGWQFGGQTTAAAKSGEGGGSLEGAAAVAPGVWMYQMTDKGLALELTGKGTKYSKDDDLN